MPNRHASSNKYRYGFNGQEKDDEVAGEANSYTAEYWQYDSRLGRRWNIDPELKTFSRYSTFANNPIRFMDPIGRDTLSFTGTNGRKIMFIHDKLPKMDVNFPVKFNIDNDVSVNFNNIGDGKLPDAFGYSYTASLDGSLATVAGSISFSKNYVFFTRDDYDYQPFPFTVGSAKGGGNLLGDCGGEFEGDVRGTLSIFYAKYNGKKEIRPESWSGTFIEDSYGVTGFDLYGGGVAVTHFQDVNHANNKGGFYGHSLDLSVGLGEGASATALFGRSFYMLNEFYPTKTAKLKKTRIGQIRFYAKWAEFMTGGVVPGTSISDRLFIIEKSNLKLPDFRARRDYSTPTFLNGLFGSKL